MIRQLALLTLTAGLIPAAEKYTVYETEHFELITDGSRGRAQDVLAQFERVRSFFVKTMAMKDPVLKPRIVLFQNEKDYRDHALNAVSAAHYIGLPLRDYIAMGPAESERNRRVAVHEYVHLLVHYTDVPLPVWLNEGVAELFSTIAAVKKGVQVGSPIPEHIFLVRNDWVALSDLVGADQDSKYYTRREHAGPFYAMSWALTHMLMLDTRYRPNYGRLAPALAAGTPPEQAFQQTFGKPLAEIDKDLQAYVRGNSVNVVNYEIAFDKVDEKTAPRAVTDYEWGVATADLLTGLRKFDQAAARLEALTNMQPQRAEAWESLTFVRWTGKQEGATAAFAKARALGSTHPNLALWAPAYLQDRAAAKDVLAITVTKYPAFSDARLRLAEMQLYNQEFQAALDTLKGLPKITPKQVRYYFPTYIQAAWYLDRMDLARPAASQFVGLAKTEEEKGNAKRWFDFAMKDFPKQLEAPVFVAEQSTFVPPREPGEFGADEDPNGMRMGRKPLSYATGAMVNLECKDPAVVHFRTGDGVMKVVIDSPGAFQMVGASNGQGELTCGPQERAAKLGYYPKEGLADGATAVARSIEFLK